MMQPKKIIAAALWALMTAALIYLIIELARFGLFSAMITAVIGVICAGVSALIAWRVFKRDASTDFSYRRRRYTGPMIAAIIVSLIALGAGHVLAVTNRTMDAVLGGRGKTAAKTYTVALMSEGGTAYDAVAAVNTSTKKIAVVTVPSDVLINGAPLSQYNVGKDAADAMGSLLGVSANRRVTLKASGLKAAVDTMNGVKVTSPESFTVGLYNFTAGTNELNGTEALAFASHSTACAELVTSAVVDKMTSGWAATHYTDAMTAVSQMMTTDFSRSELKSLMGKGLSSYTREAYAVTGTASAAGTAPDATSVSAAKTRLENVLKGQ
jgi:hypothetical protein